MSDVLAAVAVSGRPRTKGSLKPIHQRLGGGRCKVSLTESGQYAKPWKEAMIKAIQAAVPCKQHEGPVMVNLEFLFLPEHGEDVLLDLPIGREYGDIDKLERNVLDALTQSGLIKDDSQVVQLRSFKVFCHENPGVMILVTTP